MVGTTSTLTVVDVMVQDRRTVQVRLDMDAADGRVHKRVEHVPGDRLWQPLGNKVRVVPEEDRIELGAPESVFQKGPWANVGDCAVRFPTPGKVVNGLGAELDVLFDDDERLPMLPVGTQQPVVGEVVVAHEVALCTPQRGQRMETDVRNDDADYRTAAVLRPR